VFCQGEDEFRRLSAEAQQLGVVASDTPTGPVFVVASIDTPIGPLRVVKVRKPDPTRQELGDVDYRVVPWDEFFDAVHGEDGVSLIERADFRMLELVDAAYDVRLYFSDPPVEEHEGIREALQAQD
jgi:hypothetical protein